MSVLIPINQHHESSALAVKITRESDGGVFNLTASDDAILRTPRFFGITLKTITISA